MISKPEYVDAFKEIVIQPNDALRRAAEKSHPNLCNLIKILNDMVVDNLDISTGISRIKADKIHLEICKLNIDPQTISTIKMIVLESFMARGWIVEKSRQDEDIIEFKVKIE